MKTIQTVCAFAFAGNPASANARAEQHLSAIVEHMDSIMDLANIESFERDIHDSHVTLILKMALSDIWRARCTISDALAIERDIIANRGRVTSSLCGSHDHAV